MTMTKRTTKPAAGDPPTLTIPPEDTSAAIWQPQQIVHKRILDLIPNPRNAKRHSREQIDLLAGSIRTFGFAGVILVDGGGQIIAGHGRWEAAKKAGLPTVPCVVVDHLTSQQCQALGLADNRLAELGDTDEEQLDLLLAELDQAGIDLEGLGFDTEEQRGESSVPKSSGAQTRWNLLIPCETEAERTRVRKILDKNNITHHPVD